MANIIQVPTLISYIQNYNICMSMTIDKYILGSVAHYKL